MTTLENLKNIMNKLHDERKQKVEQQEQKNWRDPYSKLSELEIELQQAKNKLDKLKYK